MICCGEVMTMIKDMGIYEIWECKECGRKIEIDIKDNIKELD